MKRLLTPLFLTLFGLALVACENQTKPAYSSETPAKADSTASQQAGSTDVLVTIEGKNISEADLDGRAKGMLSTAKADLFEKQKKAVDTFLFDHLTKLEADKKKVTVEELSKNEIEGKIKKISDREIQAFYKEATKGAPAGQIPPLDKVKDRIKEKLSKDAADDRKDVYFSELKRKYKVEYKITRPTVEIGVGDSPVRGSPKAPITIVEFSDFQCPYCKKAVITVEQMLKDYKGKVKLHFRDFPLGFHPNAKPAAMAARCAGEQGKFWEFHDKLFDKQELGTEKYDQYAKELKLDEGKFKSCVASNKYSTQIEKDMEDGAGLGVTGTPAFFINGVFLSGAVPADQFKKVINEQLTEIRVAKK